MGNQPAQYILAQCILAYIRKHYRALNFNVIKIEVDVYKRQPGALYVRNDLKFKKSDIQIEIDREKAGMFGLTTAEIAKTIRLAIAGLEVSEIRDEEGEESSILVSLEKPSSNALENLSLIHI